MGIGEQIETIVTSMTGNNNPPQIVTIRKGYANNTADIITKNGILKNVKCSGQAIAGDNALLTYDNGDMQTPFVLLFNGNGGGGDLSAYVKKAEVDIVLMDNGYLKLKLDLEE